MRYKYDIKFYDKYNTMYHVNFIAKRILKDSEIKELGTAIIWGYPHNNYRKGDAIETKITIL